MYRRSRKSSSSIVSLFILGMIAGMIFLFYDNLVTRRENVTFSQFSPTPRATRAASIGLIALPTDTFAPPPTATSPRAQRPDIYGVELIVPAAGIYAPVIRVYLDGQSWDVTNLGANVGHLQGTAWLNTGPGNIALAGHVETAEGRNGVFASVKNLKQGDLVILKNGREERRYRVSSVSTVAPNDLTPLYPTATEQLTLITCGSYNFFQDAYQDRIVVVAERV